MDLTADELAGIAGLFGGLRPDELREACREVAFKRAGEEPSNAEIDAVIDTAEQSHRLVPVNHEAGTLLVPGPTAWPTVPTVAEDLPHVLDIEPRTIDRTAVARQLIERFLDEMDEDLTPERIASLRQLAYDLESWAGVDAGPLRDELKEVAED